MMNTLTQTLHPLQCLQVIFLWKIRNSFEMHQSVEVTLSPLKCRPRWGGGRVDFFLFVYFWLDVTSEVSKWIKVSR